ncbi:MAG: DMT family transporter, partial [Candidatus Aenigmarchaeota archaeon]|nr:DMT family transporter [Candidatus Aenigmarchaeota archaeon]
SAAMFLSSLYIMDRRFLSNQNLNPFVFSSFATTLGAFFATILAVVIIGEVPEISSRALLFGIGIGLLGSFGSYSYYYSLRNNEASHVAPFSKFTSVFSMVFAVILLGESVNTLTVAGVFLVGLGGYLATERNRQGHPMIDKAVILIVAATFFWAIRGIPEKIILSEIHPLALASIAALTRCALSITIGAGVLNKEWKVFAGQLRKNARDMKLLLFRGMISATSLTFYYYALSMAPVSRVVPLANTDAIFTVIFGGIFLHEKNIKKKIFGAIVAVIGAWMIVIGG